MSDVDPAVTAAEAELAKAQADLQAAQQEEATVHVALTQPWHVWKPGDGLPDVDFGGVDVPETVAAQLQAAAQSAGIALRKE